jgi:hypothetical protein
MVLQNHRFAPAQCLCNSLSFFAVQDNAAELFVHGMTFVEPQGILRHHVEGFAEYGIRLAGDTVRVASGVDVWSGFVDLFCMSLLV